jgi:threonine dehydrogenase-like Zn-dependent dehydrogenase
MPKQLVATAPRVAELLPYEERPLASDELRAQVLFASPKHGTDLPDFRGESAFMDDKFDPEWSMFAPRSDDEPRGVAFGSWNIGNMWVGRVIEAGPSVRDYALGDLVCGYGGIRETAVAVAVDNYKLRKLPSLAKAADAVCYDPAQFALAGVRDANVRPGEAVAVFGLGAIGLLAVQLCKAAGASLVAAFDPMASRRELAKSFGADAVLDPRAVDGGRELKALTAKRGVDAVIETSASPAALQAALRGLGYGGVLAFVGFGKEIKGGLNFGREAHFNNARIVFSRASSEPNPEYPRWSRARIEEVVWSMLMAGSLSGQGIVQPIVKFEDCAAAYMLHVDREPESSIKMGVRFDD